MDEEMGMWSQKCTEMLLEVLGSIYFKYCCYPNMICCAFFVWIQVWCYLSNQSLIAVLVWNSGTNDKQCKQWDFTRFTPRSYWSAQETV